MARRALSVLIVLGIVSVLTLPGHADTQSIGGAAGAACGPAPSTVAAGAQGTAGASFPNDLDGTNNCSSLCAKWVIFCKAAVAGSKTCWSKAGNTYATLKKAECATDSDPGSVQSCKDDVTVQLDAFKEGLAVNAEDGVEFCEGSGRGACIVTCSL